MNPYACDHCREPITGEALVDDATVAPRVVLLHATCRRAFANVAADRTEPCPACRGVGTWHAEAFFAAERWEFDGTETPRVMPAEFVPARTERCTTCEGHGAVTPARRRWLEEEARAAVLAKLSPGERALLGLGGSR